MLDCSWVELILRKPILAPRRQSLPTWPRIEVSTQVEEIEERLSQERLLALAYSMFGGLTLLLAVIGLFGVMSYDVTQRRHEIGIRMALGAQRAHVMWLVLGQSLLLVFIGVGLGLLGVGLAGRLVETLIYGVTATDVVTLGRAVVIMTAVAGVAAYLPARRAAGVDPIDALRCE